MERCKYVRTHYDCKKCKNWEDRILLGEKEDGSFLKHTSGEKCMTNCKNRKYKFLNDVAHITIHKFCANYEERDTRTITKEEME